MHPPVGILRVRLYQKNIYLDDLEASAQMLESLQYCDDATLTYMGRKGREVVERKYNWGIFTGSVIRNLQTVSRNGS